jgi:AAA family ATPase
VAQRHAGRLSQKIQYVIEGVELKGLSSLSSIPFAVGSSTLFILPTTISSSPSKLASRTVGPILVQFDRVAGQTAALKQLQICLNSKSGLEKFILITGPFGVGKTLILDELKMLNQLKVFEIPKDVSDSSKMKKELNKLFTEAIAHEPSLVLVDDIDQLASKTDGYSFAKSLCKEIKQASKFDVRVCATAKRFVDIHPEIFHWLSATINLRIPTDQDRFDLLKHFSQDGEAEDSILRAVADQTHAFTGSDLRRLRLCAIGVQESQWKEKCSDSVESQVRLTLKDYEVARKMVQASAMNEIYIDVPKVKWSDIGGSESLKTELHHITNETLAFMKNKIPPSPEHGVLLYGPPGCSKTLTARALASESKFNFLSVKGPQLVSKYVGETEQNIREVFQKAKAAAPSVIFFDEFDSMASRDTGHESLKSVTALLTEMDGFEELSGVLVIAATNAPWKIDPAFIRPGRFGIQQYVGLPDLDARKQILSINTKNVSLSGDVDLAQFASKTEGWSGAEVANLCRIATIQARREVTRTGDVAVSASYLQARHLQASLASITPKVSHDMLERLESWGNRARTVD